MNYSDIKLISKNVIYTLYECSNVASSKYLPLCVITKHIEKQKLCAIILYKNVCFLQPFKAYMYIYYVNIIAMT